MRASLADRRATNTRQIVKVKAALRDTTRTRDGHGTPATAHGVMSDLIDWLLDELLELRAVGRILDDL